MYLGRQKKANTSTNIFNKKRKNMNKNVYRLTKKSKY